jgi:fimbrial chaperone protein
VPFRRVLLSLLASTSALGLASTPALAGTFSISPLRVELSSRDQTGAVTIRNQEAVPVVVQAETMLWEQDDGQDRLTPTREILVSPPVFTLPANGSQLVRVALRRPADAERELSYRLLLTEVPQQGNPDVSQLSVALRLSLPIFVAPASLSRPRLEWSATRGDDGRVTVTARNAGNAHARVLTFSVAAAASPTNATPQDVTAYLLPGEARSWTLDVRDLDATAADGARIRVVGTTEAGEFDVETPLEGR